MTKTHYCGGCSNQVDTKSAVRWVRPDGTIAWFCSEPCRTVGEEIEPPAAWAPTPPAVLRDEKKVRKATMKKRTVPKAGEKPSKPKSKPKSSKAKATNPKASKAKATAPLRGKRAGTKGVMGKTRRKKSNRKSGKTATPPKPAPNASGSVETRPIRP